MSTTRISIGDKFGRLTVIKRAENTKDGATRWVCECLCGTIKTVHGGSLYKQITNSCGCKINTHCPEDKLHLYGPRGSMQRKLYYKMQKAWLSMHDRCSNPKNNSYHRYGGRGISVCLEWGDFIKFYEEMGEPADLNLQIDRINNDGNYEVNNCRWVTPKENASNTSRSNRLKTTDGVLTVKELALRIGRSRNYVYGKMRKGITPQQLLEEGK